MKILLPYTNLLDKKIDDPVIAGGIEMFCKHIYENFDCEVVYLPNIYLEENKTREARKRFKNKIIEAAVKVKPDLIVCNFEQGCFVNSEILSLNIPFIFVMHSLMTFYTTGIKFEKVNKAGQTMAMVSQFQLNQSLAFNKRIRMTNRASRVGNFFIDEFINPSYVSEWVRANPNPEFDATTIGRFGLPKNPFLMKQLLEGTDVSSTIWTTDIKCATSENNVFDKDRSYYEKNKKYLDETVRTGVGHNEMLKRINEASVYFSTWKEETWGITALEALSRGLPIVCNANLEKGHASQSIVADPKHCILIDRNTNDLVDAINKLKKLDKQEIIDKTYEKHNKEVWVKNMASFFERAIEKGNTRNSDLLRFFT